ncbi:DUF1045 domain-containing protein [Desulfovibrio cuneatus]|uniref:DUF1045 domain-containing protein n=1 Tax=Desulfovibrio cuneatus TaxID=159728 RepID=UPI00042A70F3|nr:DUF1045 domain-containing protein [Desulfovibrio cuneatus]
MEYRYAIYYIPKHETPLYSRGAALLGYDVYTGHQLPSIKAALPRPLAEDALTQEPARYGLHATVVAPFFIASLTEEELLAEAAAFCLRASSVVLPHVQLVMHRGFFALRPAQVSARERTAYAQLMQLAALAVRFFHPLQAPLEEVELRRRGGHSLTPRQQANLTRWNYPYVLDEYEFHITLTGKIAEGQENSLVLPLNSYFAPLLMDPLEIGSLCVCRQPVTPEEKRESRYASPFTVVAHFPLEGTVERNAL